MIREATLADVDALVAMGARFLASTPYGAVLPTNPDQIATLMRFLIDSPVGVVYVATDGGDLVTGMLGALCFAHLMSAEWIASELFWWVEPEARGGIAGVRLLTTAEAWARDQGATKLQMVAPIETGLGRLYGRLGFRALEVAYQKDLAA